MDIKKGINTLLVILLLGPCSRILLPYGMGSEGYEIQRKYIKYSCLFKEICYSKVQVHQFPFSNFSNNKVQSYKTLPKILPSVGSNSTTLLPYWYSSRGKTKLRSTKKEKIYHHYI